ncbi:MAG TPA: hypothetical protein VF412_08580 [Bdellovibrio sp.]|uniref:hypothetical protein n=1 Tax=Bdellovibrio sp. TaxID=28201 RepID=UPI002EE29136
MKLIMLSLGFLVSTTALAGAGFICDNYGNSCLQPGGNCSALIPPVHICADAYQEHKNLEIQSAYRTLLQNSGREVGPEVMGAACCSWGENIKECMPGC